MLTHTVDQVAREEELLVTAKDYFNFVTKFFEPINVSATHIYHSALELSPLSSIVRRLYHHQRHTPFPRVVAGTADSWDRITYLFTGEVYTWSYTWSPCGRFVAALRHEFVEIRDVISSELVSTLGRHLYGHPRLAYSPDGRSLACLSDTLRIWDIQTGGAAKEIEYNNRSNSRSIVWSLDGMTVGMTWDSTVHLYDIVSGAKLSPGTFQSSDELHLWAHNGSFQVMAGRWEGGVFTIEVFDVGSKIVKIESFHIEALHRGPGRHPRIASFSPTTYRVSIADMKQGWILDIRNSECLLEEKGLSTCQTFSSDGSLFAAYLGYSVCIWRYASGCYIPWRTFPVQSCSSLTFSPTSSSILIDTLSVLQAYPLDDPPIVAHPDDSTLLAILSPCGTYIATARRLGHTVTIANPLSQITSQFIDTYMEIENVALSGSILLVFDGEQVAAWRLTEGGLVDGVFGDRRAGDGDSIWVVSNPHSFEMIDRIAVFWGRGPIHVYHTGTGKSLDHTQTHFGLTGRHTPSDMSRGGHYPHYRNSITGNRQPRGDWPFSGVRPKAGWVKDPERKHRLWMPIEWREKDIGWLCDIQALQFSHPSGSVIIMF